MKKANKLLVMAAAMALAACTLTACGGGSKGDTLTRSEERRVGKEC